MATTSKRSAPVTRKEFETLKYDVASVLERVGRLALTVQHHANDLQELRKDLDALTALYRHHAERGDTNIQIHADVALALRQVTNVLDNVTREGRYGH